MGCVWSSSEATKHPARLKPVLFDCAALILTVLRTLLTLLQMPEGARRILFGLVILIVTTIYIRLANQSR
jgi:ribose/xylose/arabinose/galactoside ABC-type transport system permease subunit